MTDPSPSVCESVAGGGWIEDVLSTMVSGGDRVSTWKPGIVRDALDAASLLVPTLSFGLLCW